MYRYIKGNLEEIGESYVVIENNGVGYLINTSQNSINQLRNGSKQCKMYTHLNVRQDEISLYGFSTQEELDMFHLLLIVSKIGQKVALGVLSSMTPNSIKLAIASNDADSLTRAPGIGKKTASRMILELKDKIGDDINMDKVNIFDNTNGDDNEAIEALVSLGYTRREIMLALSKINTNDLETEDIIKNALKMLARK